MPEKVWIQAQRKAHHLHETHCTWSTCSAIAAMSTEGILDWYTVTGPVESSKFVDFIQQSLLPQLQPFDGVNGHSVSVLDNASIHHVDDVVESTGVVLS